MKEHRLLLILNILGIAGLMISIIIGSILLQEAHNIPPIWKLGWVLFSTLSVVAVFIIFFKGRE